MSQQRAGSQFELMDNLYAWVDLFSVREYWTNRAITLCYLDWTPSILRCRGKGDSGVMQTDSQITGKMLCRYHRHIYWLIYVIWCTIVCLVGLLIFSKIQWNVEIRDSESWVRNILTICVVIFLLPRLVSRSLSWVSSGAAHTWKRLVAQKQWGQFQDTQQGSPKSAQSKREK